MTDATMPESLVRSTRTGLPLLRTSMVRSYLGCPRRFFYEYVRGVAPTSEANALWVGTVWHKAMEVYLAGIRDGAPVLAGLTVFDEAELDDDDRARLRALYRGYCARWEASDRASLTVVSIERRFEFDLRDPDTGLVSQAWTFSGRLDGEVIEAGDPLVIEHKTAGCDIGPGTDYWRTRRIDSQNSNYLDATRARGVLYDVVHKPQHRLLAATPEDKQKRTRSGALYKSQRAHDESPDAFEERVLAAITEDPARYYQRQRVVRIGDELEEAARDRWEIAQSIADAIHHGRFPRNADACFRVGATCPFVRPCSGEASIDDPTLFHQKTESGCEQVA